MATSDLTAQYWECWSLRHLSWHRFPRHSYVFFFFWFFFFFFFFWVLALLGKPSLLLLEYIMLGCYKECNKVLKKVRIIFNSLSKHYNTWARNTIPRNPFKKRWIAMLHTIEYSTVTQSNPDCKSRAINDIVSNKSILGKALYTDQVRILTKGSAGVSGSSPSLATRKSQSRHYSLKQFMIWFNLVAST